MTGFYQTRIRPISRQAFVKIWPGPINAGRKVVISGIPRSGTSWVAKLVSLANSVSYYFEPDNTLDDNYTFKYLGPDDEDEYLHEFIRRCFRGSIHSEYVIAEQSLFDILRHPFSHTVLLKMVHLPLTLDWMVKNFPDVVVIQVIRHPVPIFQSWKMRNWDPRHALSLLLKQHALMEGPLKAYQAVMSEAHGFWGSASAVWSAIVKMQFLQHKPNFYMLEHEWLCYDAVPRFRGFIEALGLQWNARMENYLTLGLADHKSGPGYGKWRDPSSEINKWKDKIQRSELEEIWSVMKYFDLPCYRKLNISEESLRRSKLSWY